MVHDPEQDWWDGAREALRRVLEALGQRRVAGIGLAGLFPSVVLSDEVGTAIGDGILYGDSRAGAEVTAAAQLIGEELTGDEVGPRLVWLGKIREADLERARWALGPAGFVGLRLTGRTAIDPHSASRWGGLANRARDGWDAAILARLGIPPRLLPPILPPDRKLGDVTASAAAETGLVAGIPVVVGATDSFAAMLGSGLRRAGDAMIYYGGSGTLLLGTADFATAVREPATFGRTSPYRLAAYALNSGGFVDQARCELLGGRSFAELDREAALCPPGADGILVLPHVSGRMLPHPVPDARAAVVGLRLDHVRGHVWRAILESFGWVLMEAQQAGSIEVRSVVAGGGGARSAAWRQIVSNMTGWSQALAPRDATTRGAALLAATGQGHANGHAALWEQWASSVARGVDTAPDAAAHARYQDLLPAWLHLDRTLAGGAA
jgi:xylulokinase